MTTWTTGEQLTYPRAELKFHWASDVLMSGVYMASKVPGDPFLALHYTDGSVEVGSYEPELTEDVSVFRLCMEIQEQRNT